MYDRNGFLDYFTNVGGAAKNTRDTYNSFLKRIDDALGGLDEALDDKGVEAVAQWAKATDKEPFATYRSHARSVLKRYSQYRLEKENPEEEPQDSPLLEAIVNEVEADANFLREKEMQTQVRQQLASLEAGLKAIDDGKEVVVATGRIDILARDADGKLVVIELKAGKCPPGALEQLLAYTFDIEQERQEPVRAMLVAGSFGDRTRAAARRAGGVDLRSYAYSLAFKTEE